MDKTPLKLYPILPKSDKMIANKSLGQHFIFDTNICHKIIRAVPGTIENHVVLEIGPGLGALTRTILSYNPKKLILIEKDDRFICQLQQLAKNSNDSIIEVIHGDALQINLMDIASEPLIIIANLPYNIGTKLITKWLHQISCIKYIVVMLQDEVVTRIIAPLNTKEYGRLSVISQAITNCKKCFAVSPQSFVPQPTVNSSILLMTPKCPQFYQVNLSNLERIANMAFQKRRKKLKNCFSDLLKNSDTEEVAHINLENRPEQITPSQYVILSQILL